MIGQNVMSMEALGFSFGPKLSIGYIPSSQFTSTIKRENQKEQNTIRKYSHNIGKTQGPLHDD